MVKTRPHRAQQQDFVRRQGRLRGAAWMGAVIWVALIARLVQVQGVQREMYADRARNQQEQTIEIGASRGRVLDRAGRELSLDVPSTSYYCRPAALEQPLEVAAYFSQLEGRDVSSLQRRLQDSASHSFVYLARQVDDETAAQIRAQGFAGVYEQSATARYYPLRHLAGQLLGFTNVDNCGREGVEQAYDALLKGRSGRSHVFVDAHGALLPHRTAEQARAEDGTDIELTIDAVYQGVLEEELVAAIERTGAESGLGIISDPRTGDILAMASVPLFDPNNPGMAAAAMRRNRPVTDSFEPGSTFKAVSLAAVVEKGLAKAETPVFCEDGALVLANNDIITDVSPHGILTMAEVVEKSSNIGAIKLVRRMKRHDFYDYIRRFGFGTRTGIGLPAESSGLLRSTSTWSERSLETLAIGQELSVTLLQLTQAFGVIANGGLLMTPNIEKRGDGKSEPLVVRRVISEQTSAVMRKILANAVKLGTGKKAAVAGLNVAGKTGTAQRALADGGGYSADENVASFIGFAPADKPVLLCAIVVENPRGVKWGGEVAAPVFKRVMDRLAALPDSPLRRVQASGTLAVTDGSLPAEKRSVRARVMPDFRGMTEAAAVDCGRLRGLRVHVSGSGALVMDQTPLPGELASNPDGAVLCRLGTAQEVTLLNPFSLPSRQAVLLQKLGRPMLAAMH
jgi:cell division protein FtsI (penicillin-binding protein 3)